jgi:fructose-specific phosphotransferase system IIC component
MAGVALLVPLIVAGGLIALAALPALGVARRMRSRHAA